MQVHDTFDANRWFDDTLLFSWRRGEDGVGRLWAGRGSDATRTLWDAGQGQRGILHLMASKQLPAFRLLRASEHLQRLAAHCTEFHVTKHGLWLKVSREGRSHTWVSGAFPDAHALVRSSDVSRALATIAQLGKPTRTTRRRLARKVERALPCLHVARRDEARDAASRHARTCAECREPTGLLPGAGRRGPSGVPCDVINLSAVYTLSSSVCRRPLCVAPR